MPSQHTPRPIQAMRKPTDPKDPKGLSQDAQDALKALEGLDADEAADLVRLALEDDAVRTAFMEEYVTVPAGVQIGERGQAALFLAEYYNSPMACLMATIRPDPETGEWQLLVGERPNGARTLIGGHFSPFTAQECWDYFFDKGFSTRELHHMFLNETPPSNHEEDEVSQDINLMMAATKEMIQEANIFLMPKQLSDLEKDDLAKRVKKAFGPDVAISYDYDVLSKNTIISGVGEIGKAWQSVVVGYGIVLNDQEQLNHPVAGDDIAKTYWVKQSDLSHLRQKDEQRPNKVCVGDMRYGTRSIIANAFSELNREIDLPNITDEAGHKLPSTTLHGAERRAARVAKHFGLKKSDLLGDKPEPFYGEEAANYVERARSFQKLYMKNVVTKGAQEEGIEDVLQLMAAEFDLLREFALSNNLPDHVLDTVEDITAAEFERNMLKDLSKAPRQHGPHTSAITKARADAALQTASARSA